MINYKYNEVDYAKLIYSSGFQTKHIPTELRLVATYMRTILGYKPKQLREEMYIFSSKNIPEYNRVKHYKIINKAINSALKKNSTLIKIDNIAIYDYEINYINSLQFCDEDGVISEYEYDCKKVVFALLCQMKLNKIISKQKNGFESKCMYFKGDNSKYNDLKKISKIPIKFGINSDIVYILGQCGTITIMYNGLIKLDFMEQLDILSKEVDEFKTVITITNFDSVGWYFDYYNNVKKIKLCKHCGQPFRQTKNDILYCSEHKEYYQKQETKQMVCIDCGEIFDINSSSRRIRCKKCEKIERQRINRNYRNRKTSSLES